MPISFLDTIKSHLSIGIVLGPLLSSPVFLLLMLSLLLVVPSLVLLLFVAILFHSTGIRSFRSLRNIVPWIEGFVPFVRFVHRCFVVSLLLFS